MIYYMQNPNKEACEKCSTVQELADWLADGADVDAPQIATPEELMTWWSSFDPTDVLCIESKS